MGKILPLLHQKSCAGALDLAGDFAVQVSSEARHATGKDLAGFRREFAEKFRVFEVDRVGRDVKATAGHAAVCLAEVAAALFCFWCAHGRENKSEASYFVSRWRV